MSTGGEAAASEPVRPADMARRAHLRAVRPDGRARPAGADGTTDGAAQQKRQSREAFPRPGDPASVEGKAKGIPHYELHRGGRNERLDLTQATRADVAQILRNRLREAQSMEADTSKNQQLNELERLLLSKGENFAESFVANETLSRQDLALAWAVISDELVQKASASRIEIQEEPGRHRVLRRLLGERRGVGQLVGRVARADAVAYTTTEGPHFTSPYLESINYHAKDDAAKAEELLQLGGVREALEEQLEMAPDADVPELLGVHGNLFREAVDKATGNILTREHTITLPSGSTRTLSFLELQDQDPVKAEMVRIRAYREGLSVVAKESAKEVLLAEKPLVDTASIDGSIEDLKKKKEPEEIEDLQRKQTEAKHRYEAAQTRFERLREQLESAEEALEKAENAEALAIANQVANNPDLPAPVGGFAPGAPKREIEDAIKFEDDLIGQYKGEISALPASKNREQLVLEKQRLIDAAAERKRLLREEKNALDAAVAKAKAEVAQYTALITRLQGAAPRAVPPSGGGDLGTAAKARDDASKELTTATRNAEQATKGLTPERDVMVTALTQWKKTGGDGFDAIMDKRFNPDSRQRITLERLGSTLVDTSTGEVQGAEAILEHIFKASDPEWYGRASNRELAHRMVSREAMIRGIIEVYGIDTAGRTVLVPPAPGAAGPAAPITYEQCFTEIASRREVLNKALDRVARLKAERVTGDRLKDAEREVRKARTEMQRYETPLLQDVLPNVRDGGDLLAGELIRRLVKNGLDSAAKGQPYYNGEGFKTPESELTLRAQSLLESHKGVTTFYDTNMQGLGEAPRIRWEGERARVNPALFGLPPTYDDAAGVAHPYLDPTIDLDFRVTQTIDKGRVGADIDVLVTENLLKALPDNLPATTLLPEAIRDLFYEQIGDRLRFRSDLRLRDRSTLQRLLESRRPQIDTNGDMWLSVRKGTDLNTVTTNEMIMTLNRELGTGAGPDIAVAAANNVLAMDPDQRRTFLRGFDRVETDVTEPFTLLEKSNPAAVGYSIDFDNQGRFWISEIDAHGVRLGPRQDLALFYDWQAESFRRREGVQVLDTARRERLRAELQRIQLVIGSEVLSLQQAR